MAGSADRAFRPDLWLTLFALAAFVLLAGLGVWQLERRSWKHRLIADLAARTAEVPLSELPATPDARQFEFRRVRLSGRFLPGREQLFVGRSHQGRSGYGVFAPLELPAGRFVFVDRGWIPVTAKDSPVWRIGESRDVTIDGVIRSLADGEGAAVSRGNEHYRLSLAAMAKQAGLDPARSPPLYIVATGLADPRALPIPRPVAVEVTDNHLQYALTWFSLAAALAAVYVLVSRQRRRGPA